jgi:4-hydroxy-4-methyl-2-oxoglutarate aldolase
VQRETEALAAFAQGELGLDRYDLRAVLDRLGVQYVPAEPEEAT